MKAKFTKIAVCMLMIVITFSSLNVNAMAASKKSYSESDLKYLTAIIYCEAGNQSYKGKVAVANVVLNRVDSKRYPNTIKKVLYQRYQFTPVGTKKWTNTLKLYDKNSKKLKACKKAAKAALEEKYVLKKEYLSFTGYSKRLAQKHSNHQKIGAHIFF